MARAYKTVSMQCRCGWGPNGSIEFHQIDREHVELTISGKLMADDGKALLDERGRPTHGAITVAATTYAWQSFLKKLAEP